MRYRFILPGGNYDALRIDFDGHNQESSIIISDLALAPYSIIFDYLYLYPLAILIFVLFTMPGILLYHCLTAKSTHSRFGLINLGFMPVEYTLLGFKPGPFTRLDSVAIMGYVAYSFADGIKRDSLYTIFGSFLNSDDLEKIFPKYTLENRTTIMQPDGNYNGNPDGNLTASLSDPLFVKNAFAGLNASLQTVLDQVAGIAPPFAGSNSWVLAPSRSKAGTEVTPAFSASLILALSSPK